MGCLVGGFFNDTATTEIYTLSLHDALPICATQGWISVDRGSKATLPLTMPHRVFKSSAKDSARRPCGISLPDGHPWLYHRGGYTGDTSPWGPKAPTVGREANDGRERRLLARILT